ncbi:insecticidal toxin complex protein [Enhygromyxa salina]|uniref:Insecticidal toxin complex protein n=2 Tax=Enhygromyxa salina TaxID=215803 RepID=A0A0C2CK72_9BACT|nr:insecticidal toxin complex protein [Enhygromyxa salina]
MPHLSSMVWNHDDELREVTVGTETVYFQYAGGMRSRKYVEKSGATTEERIYLGSFEIYRKRISGTLDLERESIHISDDTGRICIIETKTVDSGSAVGSPTGIWRYQLSNHLGSAATEVDGSGAIISYEEYHPYGTSAYRAVNASIDVSAKRYRYTGMERDEETGLEYHSARYYAPWLGSWMAADPSGLGDGVNRYSYTGAKPISTSDKNGHQAGPGDNDVSGPDGSEMNLSYMEDTNAPDSDHPDPTPEEIFQWELSNFERKSHTSWNGWKGKDEEWAQVMEGVQTLRDVLGAEMATEILARYNAIGGLSFESKIESGYGYTDTVMGAAWYSDIYSEVFRVNERLKSEGKDQNSLLIAGVILHEFTHIWQRGGSSEAEKEYNAYAIELWFYHRAGGFDFRESQIETLWRDTSESKYGREAAPRRQFILSYMMLRALEDAAEGAGGPLAGTANAGGALYHAISGEGSKRSADTLDDVHAEVATDFDTLFTEDVYNAYIPKTGIGTDYGAMFKLWEAW